MSIKKSRFLKPGWLIVFLLIAFFVVKFTFFSSSFEFNQKIIIEKGDTVVKFTENLSTLSSLRVRRYIKNNAEKMTTLQLGSYDFSGSYTPKNFVDTIYEGPVRAFTKITILEGRSIYDIDEYLSKEGYIDQGEYISYVSDIQNINSFVKKYPFVQQFVDTKSDNKIPTTLEGLLYPDTYHLSNNQPLIPQLVKLQLQAFHDKVFESLSSQIESFSSTLITQGYSFSLGFYNIITLASVIEKEERSRQNKPLIAGIFLNRLQNNMRIDADITLCYGLKKGYEICTPTVIVQSINDDTNIYNTRKRNGLTPTPISNPSVTTIQSVLKFEKTSNLFYLHDAKGLIWTATDIAGHNNNKNTHL